MKALSEKRKGEAYLLLEILIYCFFPITATLTIGLVPPLISFAFSSIFAAAFFGIFMTLRKRWSELFVRAAWPHLFWSTVIIGFMWFGLYFTALAYTTAGNAALLVRLEILTSFVFLNLIGREILSREHLIGAAFMAVGGILVLLPNFSGINIGDILILIGICATPFGNSSQQKARLLVSSETIMFVRSVIPIPFIFFLAFMFRAHASLGDLVRAWPFFALNGIVMLGLAKQFWIEALHRMPVTKAVALNTAMPFFTLLFAWPILAQTPSVLQWASLIPLAIGALFLTDQFSFSRIKKTSAAIIVE